MSNSNADLIEEVMHKAYNRGFFKDMYAKAEEIRQGDSDVDNASAYHELKALHESASIDSLLDDDSNDY